MMGEASGRDLEQGGLGGPGSGKGWALGPRSCQPGCPPTKAQRGLGGSGRGGHGRRHRTADGTEQGEQSDSPEQPSLARSEEGVPSRWRGGRLAWMLSPLGLLRNQGGQRPSPMAWALTDCKAINQPQAVSGGRGRSIVSALGRGCHIQFGSPVNEEETSNHQQNISAQVHRTAPAGHSRPRPSNPGKHLGPHLPWGHRSGLAMRHEETTAAPLSSDPMKCHTERHSVILAPQLGRMTGMDPPWGPKPRTHRSPPVPGLTQLPLVGTHGLHHPDGQGRLQHGDGHVCKADGPLKGARRLAGV